MKNFQNGNKNVVVSIQFNPLVFFVHKFFKYYFLFSLDLTFQLAIGGTVINSTDDSKYKKNKLILTSFFICLLF